MPSIPQLFKWSPRPDDHLNTASPNPADSPASQFSSRFNPFSTLHTNVRSMINGSSVYSQSPNPNRNSTFLTPKIPFLERFRRDHPPAPIAVPGPNDPPRESSDSRSPLQPQHTAGSYMRTIAPLRDPRETEGRTVYNSGPRQEDGMGRHPADVPLDYGGSGAPATGGHEVQSGESLEEINERRRRRRRRRRRHHNHTRNRNDAWVRGRSKRSCMSAIKGTAARGKLIACVISGLFLVTVLAIYLALALARTDLGQEVHVLFIMVVLVTTIFFCHSLIRLCMLILHPPAHDPTQQADIPAMTGPEGFQPMRPIQVHLARDEDLDDGYDEERELDAGTNDRENEQLREKPVLQPPPAYGLWRSSVRVDPNLLHWQRVNNAEPLPANARSVSAMSTNSRIPASRNGSVSSASPDAAAAAPPAAALAEENPTAPRPPSYVSEDGVSYIVEAAPRSTVAMSHTGVSDIHPAWRPGYAVSEVAMDEWPRGAQGPVQVQVWR